LFHFRDISTLTSHILLVNGWGWRKAPRPPATGSASVCGGGSLWWRSFAMAVFCDGGPESRKLQSPS